MRTTVDTQPGRSSTVDAITTPTVVGDPSRRRTGAPRPAMRSGASTTSNDVAVVGVVSGPPKLANVPCVGSAAARALAAARAAAAAQRTR